MRLPRKLLPIGVLFAVLMLIACDSSEAQVTPWPSRTVPVAADYVVTRPPSYGRDIQPVFDRYCVKCHGPKRADKGLRLDGYEHTMAGSKYGTVIMPYSSGLSLLLSGLEHGVMPPGKEKPSPNEVKNIMFWIDAGAPDN